MLTDLDRKILAKACGIAWKERRLEHGIASFDRNPTFATPDDWELVREKVVVPNLNDFEGDFNLLSLYGWLLKSPEECCQDAAGFIKSRPDLFPWVVEIAEITEKSCPPEKTQIIKGTREMSQIEFTIPGVPIAKKR